MLGRILRALRKSTDSKVYAIQRQGERGWADAEILETDVPFMSPAALREYVLENYPEPDGIYRLVVKDPNTGKWRCAWEDGIKKVSIGVNPFRRNRINLFGFDVKIKSVDDIIKLKEAGILDSMESADSVERRILDLIMEMWIDNIRRKEGIKPSKKSKIKEEIMLPGADTKSEIDIDKAAEFAMMAHADLPEDVIKNAVVKLKSDNPELFQKIAKAIQEV